MFKTRHWIGVFSAPILLASAGCSIYQRPYTSASNRGLSPERMMAMAKTFERQGHLPQAKNAYFQVLAVQPGFPDAQQSLDTLIAKEMRQQQMLYGNPAGQPNQIAAQPRRSNNPETRLTTQIQQSSTQSTAGRTNMGTPSVPSTLPLSTTPSSPIMPAVQEQSAAQQPAAIESVRVDEQLQIAEPAEAFESPLIDQQPLVINQPTTGEPLIVVEESLSLELSTTVEPSGPVDESQVPERPQFAVQSPVAEALPLSLNASVAAQVPVVAMAPAISVSTKAGPLPPSSSTPRSAQSEEVAKTEDVSTFAVVTGPELITSDSEFLPPIISSDVTKPWIDTRDRSKPADELDIDLGQVANAELHPFFGPFKIELVQELKDHRERLQGPLAALVADHTVQSNVRARAIFLLGTIGPEATEVVPILRREMHNDPDLYTRIDLSEAILKIQPEDVDAIKVLVECLKHPQQELKWAAVFSLRNAASPQNTFVIDDLRAILPTGDQKLQRMIFLTLAEFGPAAAKAIPELEAALESSRPSDSRGRQSLAGLHRTKSQDRVKVKADVDSNRVDPD